MVSVDLEMAPLKIRAEHGHCPDNSETLAFGNRVILLRVVQTSGPEPNGFAGAIRVRLEKSGANLVIGCVGVN